MCGREGGKEREGKGGEREFKEREREKGGGEDMKNRGISRTKGILTQTIMRLQCS